MSKKNYNLKKLVNVKVTNFPDQNLFGVSENRLLIIITGILAVLTIASIFTTLLSIKITNSIRDIEVYLAKERMREQINENIVLANNLIFELNLDKGFLVILNNSLDDLSNNPDYLAGTTSTPIKLLNQRISQAQENPSFGNDAIRKILDMYNPLIKLLNSELEGHREATKSGDIRIKKEKIGEAKKLVKAFLVRDNYFLNIDKVIEEIENYKKSENEKLSKINTELFIKITKEA